MQIPGLTAPAVVDHNVRTMSDADRDAIHMCDDRDGLIELRGLLLAAKSRKASRIAGMCCGAALILNGVLRLNSASRVVLTWADLLLIGIGVATMGISARERARVKRSETWIIRVDMRLRQLPAKADARSPQASSASWDAFRKRPSQSTSAAGETRP